MTRKDSNRTVAEIKALIAQDSDFLRPVVRTVIQEFLEAEMAEAVGAQKGERACKPKGRRWVLGQARPRQQPPGLFAHYHHDVLDPVSWRFVARVG